MQEDDPEAEFEEVGPDAEEIEELLGDQADGEEGANGYVPSDFTEHLMLSYLLANPQVWTKCLPILKKEYFRPEFGNVLSFAKKFHTDYKRLPPLSVVRAETGVVLDLPEDRDDHRIHRYLYQKIEEFARHRATELFLYESAEKLDKEEKTRALFAGFEKRMAEITRISITRDLGIEIHNNVQNTLQKAKENDGISTGLSMLDRCLDGGVNIPSFNLVSAASGDGKSIFLQNMAINYIEQGSNVVFYTLELEPETIIKRFAAMMTNTSISQIYSNIDSVAYQIAQRGRSEGKLWIKKFPMSGTTIADIQAHYDDLLVTTGEEWPRIIIDYVDVMTPVREGIKLDNIHLKDKYVCEEINDFAHDVTSGLKIVWSASQQVKGAQDEKDARQSGVAGGAGKVNTCDNLIIMKRTAEDRALQMIWAHFEKARSSGAKGMKVPISWNADTQRQTDGPEELFIEANSFIFGRVGKDKSKVSNDPIARAVGVNPTPPPMIDAKTLNGQALREKLLQRFPQRKE